MSYPTGRAERYRKAAEELSHLAESASSDFIRSYYQRTAERCLLVAEGEEAPLPKWATAASPSESSPPLSGKVISTVPEQGMPPLDEATAPLTDEDILSRSKPDQPLQSDSDPTPAHGRSAGHMVRELARRVSRLALTTN